jgi:hypothetical protein
MTVSLTSQNSHLHLLYWRLIFVAETDAQRKTLVMQKISEYKERMDTLKDSIAKRDLSERMSKLGVGTLPSVRTSYFGL